MREYTQSTANDYRTQGEGIRVRQVGSKVTCNMKEAVNSTHLRQ